MAATQDPFRVELLPGTLDLLILKTLSVQPMHGYGIAGHIGRLSAAALKVEEGSLYPALQRLKLKGWVKAEWKLTPTKRRARYYALTPAGPPPAGPRGLGVRPAGGRGTQRGEAGMIAPMPR